MNKPANGCENLEMYAVGGLDPEERAEFERHLQECAACTAELAELIELVDLLPMAVEPVQIPVGMKERVLGHIFNEDSVEVSKEVESGWAVGRKRRETKGSPWKPWIYGGLSAAVLILGVYSYNLQQDNRDLKLRIALLDRPPEAVKVNDVVTLSGTAQDIVAKGLATIVIDAKGTHLLVQAEKLPELKNNEAYQVWLIKGKDTPVNAGTFLTHNGTGGLYYTFDPNNYDTIAITLEPDAHGDKPRGKPILAANLVKS
ncbi:anti-sigma factor [Paenibacillus sp. HWE-109]|uniref:anti-sigma factor n=1 Tax=Paenibacillus sp. HWE-109 TaxID=1306526 RepID=UPI001EE1497C|nr:anti-sigma factor [Paenibacillus sp. HWE-109]UKS27264.1 anti-sigma factor [Paenibacillus sp. HWE-109]